MKSLFKRRSFYDTSQKDHSRPLKTIRTSILLSFLAIINTTAFADCSLGASSGYYVKIKNVNLAGGASIELSIKNTVTSHFDWHNVVNSSIGKNLTFPIVLAPGQWAQVYGSVYCNFSNDAEATLLATFVENGVSYPKSAALIFHPNECPNSTPSKNYSYSSIPQGATQWREIPGFVGGECTWSGASLYIDDMEGSGGKG